MKKISYLVLCGALLSGAMESWGVNDVDFGFANVQAKNRLARVAGGTAHLVRNINFTDVNGGVVDNAGGVLRTVEAVYNAMYPGADFLAPAGGGAAPGGQNAHAEWFLNNNAVDLGGGAAVLTDEQKQFFMEECLGAVFGGMAFGDELSVLIEGAGDTGLKKEKAWRVGPNSLGGCVPVNNLAANVNGAKDECARKYAGYLKYFDQEAFRDLVVAGVKAYIKASDVDDGVFNEDGLRRGLERIGIGVVQANIGAIDRNSALLGGVVGIQYDAGSGMLKNDSGFSVRKVELDEEQKVLVSEGSKKAKEMSAKRIKEQEDAAEQARLAGLVNQMVARNGGDRDAALASLKLKEVNGRLFENEEKTVSKQQPITQRDNNPQDANGPGSANPSDANEDDDQGDYTVERKSRGIKFLFTEADAAVFDGIEMGARYDYAVKHGRKVLGK